MDAWGVRLRSMGEAVGAQLAGSVDLDLVIMIGIYVICVLWIVHLWRIRNRPEGRDHITRAVHLGEAGNGLEAIARAKEMKPDVLVMDLSMPELDGAAAAERLQRECPEVKVIALTAHDDRAHLTRLLQAGAAGYVLKRGAADELVRAIRAVADGATYVDPTFGGSVLRRVAHPFFADPGAEADPLSEREEEVLRRVAWGESNQEIAGHLGISTKTVETYKSRITGKLGLRNRTELVRYAVQRGWLAEG